MLFFISCHANIFLWNLRVYFINLIQNIFYFLFLESFLAFLYNLKHKAYMKRVNIAIINFSNSNPSSYQVKVYHCTWDQVDYLKFFGFGKFDGLEEFEEFGEGS